METTVSTGLSTLLSNVSLVFEFVNSGIMHVCNLVITQPLLLIGVILMMIGFVVGICKRLISTF